CLLGESLLASKEFLVSDEAVDRDWKLRLRYGQLRTAFKHYTAIAEGVAGVMNNRYPCRPGNAFMAMKTWATSPEESAELVRMVGERIGFRVTGNTEVYDSEPEQPPLEK